MKRLFVVYDPRCGLCSQIRTWIERQPAYVPMQFVPSGSPVALRLLPSLPAGELAVVSEAGETWVGNRAWILCLWAMKEYRSWAYRLSRPSLLPYAQQAFALLSKNRAGLSRLLHLRSDAEAGELPGPIELPHCSIKPS